jgi:predicted GNAT superfamily acetyltransferase
MSGGAWELAHEAASAAGVRLRPLTSLEDAAAIVRVMRETWEEELPRELIRALAASGNVPWGAVDGDELIGYVLGWAAIEPTDGLHEHSHMLAALPDRRHAGVGYALKLAQRASCLDRGIGLVRWTFDPLVARNAHLNIGKLGATCDRFHRDYYGEMTDAVNAGDRSDRLVVRWLLDREPGPRAAPTGDVVEVVRARGTVDALHPERAPGFQEMDPGSVCTIQVPRDHAAIRSRDPELGARWREVVGEALDDCFAGGMEVVAFDADLPGGRPRYFLAERRGVRS